MELCGNQPALFVIDMTMAYDHCGKCYDKNNIDYGGGDDQFYNHVNGIYKKHKRKNSFAQNYVRPLIPNRDVENWIANPEGVDMYTKTDLIHGLSHDIVVCFQQDDPDRFEHNVCMRSRAILIVVYLPAKAYENKCFCYGAEEDEKVPTLLRIGANGQPIYDTGDQGSKDWKKNKKTKKKSKKRF